MKKQLIIRTLCLIIILCLSVSAASAATLPAGGIQPRYARILQFYADLEITSIGRADCYAYVALANSADRAELTMTLQRSSDGISWTDVKSWTTTGQGTVYLDKSYYVLSGYDYQVVATVNVFTSSGVLAETASTFSRTVER